MKYNNININDKNEEPLRNQPNFNNRCICDLGEVVHDNY